MQFTALQQPNTQAKYHSFSECFTYICCLVFGILISLSSHAQETTTLKHLTPDNNIQNQAPIKNISIGTPPWVSSHVAKLWALHLDNFDGAQHLNFKLHSAINYKEYILKSIDNAFDVLLAPAYMAAYLVKYHNFQILCQGPYQSDIHIIALQDSNTTNIQKLNERSIGFPDPLSNTSIYGQHYLEQQGIKFKKHHYGRHDQVVSSVLNQSQSAGVVVQQILTNLKPVINGRLQSLHRIKSKSSALMIAPSHIDPAMAKRIQKVLLQSNSSKTKFVPTWSLPNPNSIEKHYQQEHLLIEHLKQQLPIK